MNNDQYNSDVGQDLESLYRENFGLVHKVCNDFNKDNVIKGTLISKDDLLGEASLYFTVAYQDYKKEKGTSFIGYAYSIMYYSLQRLMNKNKTTAKFSKEAILLANQLYYSDDYLNFNNEQLMSKYDIPFSRLDIALKYIHYGKTTIRKRKIQKKDNDKENDFFENIFVSNDDLSLFYLFEVGLSEKQLEVAELLAMSYTPVDISDMKGVSRQAIQNIKNKIKKKLLNYYQCDKV